MTFEVNRPHFFCTLENDFDNEYTISSKVYVQGNVNKYPLEVIGGFAVKKVLQLLPLSQELRLTSCLASGQGQVIASAIKTNNSLRELRLDSNHFSLNDFAEIAEALKSNQILNRLTIRVVPVEAFIYFEEALKFNYSLETCDLVTSGDDRGKSLLARENLFNLLARNKEIRRVNRLTQGRTLQERCFLLAKQVNLDVSILPPGVIAFNQRNIDKEVTVTFRKRVGIRTAPREGNNCIPRGPSDINSAS